MLALFHRKEVKITDYTAIQELLTRVMKWKTFDLYCGTLFMLTEIRGLFFHMYSFLIRQFSYYGTISRFNRLSIQKLHVAPSIT